jgi:pimeloyl-ACP methyl ester carboxylesterase
MAHGFGGTRDSGLLPFAHAFASAGIDTLVFDYRGFGDSEGTPRQLVSFRRHRRDYAAAIKFARMLDGVDPDRIALWGSSYGGGHVLAVAADDPRIAAVVAQVAAVDGLVALTSAIKSNGLAFLVKVNLLAMRDILRSLTGRPPLLVPIVGPPGSVAAMNSPDAESGMTAFAGATWRNEFAAREMVAIPFNRPITRVGRIRCPVLLQIGEHDAVAPADAIESVARRLGGRAEVRRYPAGHFDVYVEPWLTKNIEDQVAFFTKHLTPTTVDAAERP